MFAMWYGKGPGVDRAGDAIRHGNAAGTSRRGGVLMVVGDDHAATSSSIPNASDLSLMGWGIPIVHPASVDEYEAFGLWGWAASRHASTWVAFKAISETVESARSVEASSGAALALPEASELPDTSALEYRTSDFLTPAVELRLAAKLEAFLRRASDRWPTLEGAPPADASEALDPDGPWSAPARGPRARGRARSPASRPRCGR